MSDKQVFPPNLTNVIDNLKKDILKNINCINVGTIQTFDKDNQTATIKLSIKKIEKVNADGTRVLKERPLLLECPCIVISGGTASLRMPIQKGDLCLVFSNDRDIDNWFIGGDGQPPNTYRTHDLSDSFALVGLFNLTNALTDYLDDQVTLQYNATNKIELQEDKININSPEIFIGTSAFEFLCQATKLKDFLNNQIKSPYDSHTHTVLVDLSAYHGPGAVAPGTISAPSATMGSASESDIASEKHKVGD